LEKGAKMEIKRYKNGNKELRIVSDEIGDSPREWDNLGKIAYRHRNYTLGEVAIPKELGSIEEIEKWLQESQNALFFIPLYIYEHSGVSLSISREYPFNDRWDSGQVGYIFITKAKLDNEGLDLEKDKDKIFSILKGEIETFNQYLNGEVYGFQMVTISKCDKCEHEHADIGDSCYGFYGDDWESNGLLEHAEISLQDFKDNWKEVE
jgi:hypothetical protein